MFLASARGVHGTRGSGAGVFRRERGNVGRRAAAMGSRGNGGTTRARSGGDGSEGEGRGKGKGKGGGGGRKGRGTVITSSPEEVKALRAKKLDALGAVGQRGFEYRYDRTKHCDELQSEHEGLENGVEVEGSSERVCGRVMAKRSFGKLAFLSLQDERGSVQLFCDKKRLEETSPGAFEMITELIDVGDIIGVRGSVKRSDKGELSIVPAQVQMLTKALLPLPDKWHGLTDVEKRYRQRYVDLIVSPDVRNTFKARSNIISTIRRMLDDDGFLEMETPVLHTQAGGADAKPFNTFHNALGMQLTLRIATELHLKRLIVGGFEPCTNSSCLSQRRLEHSAQSGIHVHRGVPGVRGRHGHVGTYRGDDLPVCDARVRYVDDSVR